MMNTYFNFKLTTLVLALGLSGPVVADTRGIDLKLKKDKMMIQTPTKDTMKENKLDTPT